MEKIPRKILVIDDDLMMIRIAERQLLRNGCTVTSASDGKLGIEKARSEQPDAILLDLMLPDIQGQEVAKQLLNDPLTKNIPIIFMSVTVGVENDKGDEQIEVNGQKFRIFAKPLHQAKLWSVIRKAINRVQNQS